MIDKKSLSERDICTKFITPAIKKQVGILKHKYLKKYLLPMGKYTLEVN
jgi:hypothetical protein